MRPMTRAALLVLALALLLPTSSQARSRAGLERAPVPTVVRGVHVFEAETGTLTGPFDVVLDGGRILTLEAPGTRPVGKGVREVDGAGKTLLPGLVESHAHVLGDGDIHPNRQLPDVQLALTSAIACGVTTVVDTADWERPLLAWLRRLDRGAAGPKLYIVGRMVTVPGGHPAALIKEFLPPSLHAFVDRNLVTQVGSVEQIPSLVEQRVAMGATALKVALDDLPPGVPQMDDATLAAIVREAHARELPVWAHVGEPEDVTQGLAAGVDLFVHIPNRGVIRDEDVAVLAARGVPVMTTLHVFRRIAELARRDVALSDLERALAHPRPLAAYAEGLDHYEIPEAMRAFAEANADGQAAMLESVRKLHAAGVPLLAGSDTSNVGSFLGPGLHHELDLLVEADLTPAQALTAATWTPGTVLDEEALFGAVRPGWQADLVLVEGDPTQGLAPVHRPLAVWVDGRAVRLPVIPSSEGK